MRESRAAFGAIRFAVRGGRARVLVARALRELGDEDSAAAELAVARRRILAMGAAPGVQESTSCRDEFALPDSPNAKSRC